MNILLNSLSRLLLLDPEPSDGGWRDSLPDDLKENATLANVPDVPTLAKNYVETKNLVGKKRLEAPAENWGDSEWGSLYTALGRPETHDSYKEAEVEFPDGMKKDDGLLKSAKEVSHKLGLTQKQFEGITEWFFKSEIEQQKSASASAEEKRNQALAALREDWKDDYDKNLDIAQTALRQFGGDDFFKYIDESGLGNNPEMVKVFKKIGDEVVEDSLKGKGTGLNVNEQTAAKIEIDALKVDEQFMKAFMDKHHIGHKGAVEKWRNLHARAYGTEPIPAS